MGLHQTKEPSAQQKNHQQNKKTTTKWEKMFANETSDKGG